MRDGRRPAGEPRSPSGARRRLSGGRSRARPAPANGRDPARRSRRGRTWLALGLATLLVAARSASGADVSVRARLDRERVYAGETVNLLVEVRGVQNAPPPELGSVAGLTVRYVGPSTQVSIVNGAMHASITHRFAVTAGEAGRFTIGPIVVAHEGATYDGGRVTLRVLPATAPAAPGAAAPRRPAAGPAGDQLQLVLAMPRTRAYLHERLPLTVQLRIGNVRVSDLQYPEVAGDGFAVEPFPQPAQRQARIGAGVYQVLDFATVLTPLRSGTLAVGPATMTMTMATGRDRFFGTFFGIGRPVELHAEGLALEVLPLPAEGRPAAFSGAVGRFDLEVRAEPTAPAAGDPVTVTMTVRGAGNLGGVTPPEIAGDDALRVYPVQQTRAETAGADEVRVFEQVVIPQRPGPVALPALAFHYFDPAAGAYGSATSAPIALAVGAPTHAVAPPQVVGDAPARAPVAEELGRDIVFIKSDPGRLVARGARLHARPLFWALLPLPLLAWLAVVVWDRRRQRLHGDAGYARFTRAGRTARRALADAEAALSAGDRRGFYDHVAAAVRDYLAAKLDLPLGAVSADAIAARPIAAEVADEIRALLATCERVRFAPDAGGEAETERALARARAIVSALERERRLAPPAAAVLALALLAGLAGTGLAGAAAAPPAAAPAGGVPGGAGAAGEHPEAVFFRANELYAAERYADAAAAYERVLALGVESGPLHFNLGNAYFKQGDVGRAVLGYERARRLLPRDPDVAANLAYARTLADGADGPPLWARLALPLAARMTTGELLAGAAIAYTVLMLLLILTRLAPRAARAGRRAAAGAAVVLAVLATSAAYRLLTVELRTAAVVVGTGPVAVRFEPSPGGTEHYPVAPGRVLRVLAERGDWAQVARGDGKRGWIERGALVEI